MYFRACRQVSCGCCSLGFVVGGTFTALLVLHVMNSYNATKDMVLAGYSSTGAHSLLSEEFHTMEGQRNPDESETTTEQRTSEISKASVQYKTKEAETSTITTYKGTPPCADVERLCADWARQGECENNPHYMLLHCKKSCQVC